MIAEPSYDIAPAPGLAPPPGPEVYIVDDDPAVRASALALLASHGREAEAYESAGALLQAIPADASGCLLLDIRMPGADGLSVLPAIRARLPGLVVVMITAHADVDAAVRALKTGAEDFLKKPWRRDAFFEAVDQAVETSRRRRRARLARDAARDRLDRLTPRETDVFRHLVTGAANKVIARRLDLSPRTVEFHRARIFEKTGLGSVAELVRLQAESERELPGPPRVSPPRFS